MTHDEMIAVIAAHALGEKIEARKKVEREWFVATNLSWNFALYDYRIAKTPVKRVAKCFDTGNSLEWVTNDRQPVPISWNRVPALDKELEE